MRVRVSLRAPDSEKKKPLKLLSFNGFFHNLHSRKDKNFTIFFVEILEAFEIMHQESFLLGRMLKGEGAMKLDEGWDG